MSRVWWGWATRWNGPETRSEAPRSDERAPDDQPDRLNAPTGVLSWICQTASGGKTDHDHEWQAVNRAAQSAGSVVYPCVVEIEEEAS